jgi:hypothetical protein
MQARNRMPETDGPPAPRRELDDGRARGRFHIVGHFESDDPAVDTKAFLYFGIALSAIGVGLCVPHSTTRRPALEWVKAITGANERPPSSLSTLEEYDLHD